MDKDRLTIIYRLVSNGSISCEEFIKLMEKEDVNILQPITIPINEPYTLPGKNYPPYEPIPTWYTTPTITCSGDSYIGELAYTLI